MTTSVTTDTIHVEKLSKLAHIALDDSEKKRIAEKLSSVFQWIGQMDQLVLTEAPCDNAPGFMRHDGPAHNESSDDIIRNAPLKDNHFFVVPRVLE
jgi:aspartyl-tRNA(Asn)/glutamyl-tRNA(Gln) amidotransferase subunit C